MHVSIDVLVEAMDCPFPCTIDVIRREDRRSIATIAQGSDASSNALAIIGGADVAAIAEASHVLAVIAPDEPVPESDAQSYAVARTQASLDVVHACACSALVSLSNWDSRLLEAIAARQPLDVVLELAEERLSNPIALFDSKLALLAYAGSFSENAEGTIWEDVLLNRFSPIEYYTRDEQLSIARTSRRAWPSIIRPSRDPRFRNLSRAIIVNGQVMGSIGQVDVTSPFTPGQVALADLVADRLQIALLLRLGGSSDEDDTDYLLRSVLNGNKTDKGLAELHLRRLGWSDDTVLRLLVCSSGGDSLTEDDDASFNRISKSFPHVPAILYEGMFVMLVPDSDPASDAKLGQLMRKLGKRGAVSEPFKGITRARVAYEQCRLALDTLVGPAWSEAPIVVFSDAFASVLCRAIDPELDPSTLCDPVIWSLAKDGYRGDHKKGHSLTRELYAYLMNGCNAHLTAHQLFMHRNTLLYRIGQIEDLLGIQLASLSSSRRLFLIVSCLVALSQA